MEMCGSTLEIEANETVTVRDYCDTKQTLSKLNDDRCINMYDRANHFRINNDYGNPSFTVVTDRLFLVIKQIIKK